MKKNGFTDLGVLTLFMFDGQPAALAARWPEDVGTQEVLYLFHRDTAGAHETVSAWPAVQVPPGWPATAEGYVVFDVTRDEICNEDALKSEVSRLIGEGEPDDLVGRRRTCWREVPRDEVPPEWPGDRATHSPCEDGPECQDATGVSFWYPTAREQDVLAWHVGGEASPLHRRRYDERPSPVTSGEWLAPAPEGATFHRGPMQFPTSDRDDGFVVHPIDAAGPCSG